MKDGKVAKCLPFLNSSLQEVYTCVVARTGVAPLPCDKINGYISKTSGLKCLYFQIYDLGTNYTCNKGGYQANGTCYDRGTAPKLICPIGYRLSDGKCTTTK